VATVWLAKDRETDGHVALKITENRRHFHSLTDEFAVSSRLHHPHLVHASRCVRTPHKIILVETFADRGELFSRVVRGVGVPESLVRTVMTDILDGLAHLHANNLVHRDLKPENVVLDSQRGAMICDFGSVELSGTCVTAGPGTMPYLPPEALASTYIVDPSFDVWCLGISLFVLLAGDFLWLAPKLDDVDFAAFTRGHRCHPAWSTLSIPMRNLLEKMLSLNPHQRPSLSEVRKALSFPFFTALVACQRETNFACCGKVCDCLDHDQVPAVVKVESQQQNQQQQQYKPAEQYMNGCHQDVMSGGGEPACQGGSD